MSTVLVTAALIAFAGLFLRGLVGFGSSLIMTPFLLLLLDVRTAVVATALTQVIVGSLMAYRTRQDWNLRALMTLLPTTIVGIVLGSSLLVSIQNESLKRAFGVITMLFALRILIALQAPIVRNARWPSVIGYLAGSIGGIMGGAFGTSGPPVVVFLENQLKSKVVLRATLLLYFVVVDSWRLANYAYQGLFSGRSLMIGVIMIPAAAFGAIAGSRLTLHTGETMFRAGIGIVLLVTGAILAI